MPILIRSLRRWCLALCLGIGLGAPAAAAPALALGDEQVSIDAWQAITVLADPSHGWQLADVRQRLDAFAPHTGAHANLGPQRAAVWLHLPLQVPAAASARWVLEIDYPPLNRIDAYVVSEGRPVAHAVLGNAQRFDARPLRSRAHTLPLALAPGQRHEVYLRVQTGSAMVLPIRLYREDAFWQHEGARLMMHGLLIGMSLALLVYSAANGFAMRDPLYAQYAVMLGGVLLFVVHNTGIGQQFLWDEQGGLLARAAPLSVLLALVGGTWFVAGALRTHERHPRITFGLHAISGVAAAGLLLSATGVLDYRQTQLLATALGPVPILLALHVALRQAWRGDRIGQLMVLGWGAYTLGALTLTGMLRGWLAADFWTLHLFQFTSLIEMLAWLRVLGLRIEQVQRDAARARIEREALVSQAQTDPLTGLPNRRGLDAALHAALPQGRDGSLLAVYMLDLDGFKAVNDHLGHDAGDALLMAVGRRLRAQVRDGDVVARLGGDEFVVVSAGLREPADAQRLQQVLQQAFATPFDLGGRSCDVGLSIGHALAPRDARDARALLKCADAAMYADKLAGRLRRPAGRRTRGASDTSPAGLTEA